MKLKYYILSVATLALTACGNKETGGEEGHHHHHHEADPDHIEISELQASTIGLETDTLQIRTLGSGISAVGVLKAEPNAQALVSPLVAGTVSALPVSVGQTVGRGQTVAVIESPEIVSICEEYLSARDEAGLAADELRRQEALAAEGAGVRMRLEQARTANFVAANKMNALSERLRIMGITASQLTRSDISASVRIVAPISGTVSNISAIRGSLADSGSPLLTITDNSRLYVSLRVYEQDLGKLHIGQPVVISLTNRPGENFSGTLQSIGGVVPDDTRAIEVRVKTEGPLPQNLLNGMAVKAIIETATADVTCLPDVAVFASGNEHYVFVLAGVDEEDGNRIFERRDCTIGVSEGGYTAVSFTPALAHGTQIATNGAFYLSSIIADHGEHNH